VRQQLREDNDGLPPNDPNHDHGLSVNAQSPLCKYDLDYQSHMSLDHDTYDRRYWYCLLSTSMFNWGWNNEKLRKVVSVLHLCCIFLIMLSLIILFS
jgi:hypothetical protein